VEVSSCCPTFNFISFPHSTPFNMPRPSHIPSNRGNNKPYSRPAQGERRPYRPSDSSAPPPSRRYDPSQPRPRPQGRVNGPYKGPGAPKAASTALDLSNKALEEPPKDDDLVGLTKLNLTSCQLTSISFVRAAAASLTWLNVSGNRLSGPEAWNGVEELKGLFGSSFFLFFLL
jgi:Leucine-rich repeat (LRR) protein